MRHHHRAVRKLLFLAGAAISALLVIHSTSYAASVIWRCEFPDFSEPVTFIAEVSTGKGKFIANSGTAEVFVHEGTTAISFVEFLVTGAVQVTTIVLRTGEAAHSQNTVMSSDGIFTPSQVSGKCKLWN